jgi:hypothetical protein
MAFLSSFYPQPVVKGTTAGTFAEGNDPRLSDARTPLSHVHGNISNTGTIGSTSGLPVVTTTSGAISTLALGTANQVLRVNSGATGVEFGAGFDAASPPAIGNTTPAAISGTTGTFTTLTANSGTITASTPLAVTQTWNNSATFFRAIETNITNTNSQTESYHLACSVGGSLVAYIRRDGRIVGGANVYGSINLESALLPQGVAVGSNAFLGLCSNTFANESGCDTRLFRDAADTFAQRRTTNAQTFRIYNTFTSATNFERLNIIAQSAGSVIIGTEKGSVGGTARGMELRTDNVARISIGSAGEIGFFGATAAAQPTAVADATDAATVITQLNALLSRMRTLGLIAT